MFKALKAIFSTPAQATKVADAVIKGADAAWFTAEEQSEWFIRYLEATQPQNLSRRIIAISITAVWVLSALVLLFLTIIAALLESTIVSGAAAAVFKFMDTIINVPFMVVIGFYFAKGIAGNLAKK